MWRPLATFLLTWTGLACSVGAQPWPAQETGPEAAPAAPSASLPEHGASSPETAPLDQFMRQFVRAHEVPSASLAVMRDGELLYARAFGWAHPEAEVPARPESRYRIASLSKPVTAVAILRLVEQGKLELQENPWRVLDMGEIWKQEGRDPRLADITIEQLLHHRAGWDREASFDPMFVPTRVRKHLDIHWVPTTSDIIRFMLDQPLDHDPGSRYAYSNFGYCVLGRVIEARSGMSYAGYVKAHVLEPLGIQSMRIGRSLPDQAWPLEVHYVDGRGRTRLSAVKERQRVSLAYAHDQEVMDAHGGWIGTAADLARFAAAFADPEAPALLTAESVLKMWAAPEGTQPPVWYGMGWSVRDVGEGRVNAWHTGLLTGGTSALMVRRHDGFTWAVLFNTDRSRTQGRTLAGLIDGPLHGAVDAVRSWKR